MTDPTPSDRPAQRALEWESLAKPLVLEHLGRVHLPVPPFMPGVRTITIKRDESFQLRLVADGVLKEGGEIGRRHREGAKILLGSFHSPSDFSLNFHGSTIDLRMHVDYEPSESKGSAAQTTYAQHAWIERMRWTSSTKPAFDEVEGDVKDLVPLGPPAWVSDWYLNGATGFHFNRLTKRKVFASFKRERPSHLIAVNEGVRSGSGGSWDHIFVDCGDLRFGYCKVPEEMAPRELHPISLEFLSPFPEPEIRKAIGEIVSFVIGRRMMQLGSTTFDGDGWSIADDSVNPWGNVRLLCGGGELPPIDYAFDGAQLETILATLVPRYLVNRESLGLDDALWAYWIAAESPPSVDLPILASAIDGLRLRWFKSKKSKSTGLHMKTEDFDNLAGDLVAELRSRVEAKKAPKEIAKNFAGANRMGLTAQTSKFFDEIGLPVGSRERDAIDARHRSAHGGLMGEDLVKAVRLGRAYRTLFDRVFLRLLDYEGAYVDRTTEGFPSRPLLTPAGEEG